MGFNWLSLDFEYNKSYERMLNLVCGSVRTSLGDCVHWLHKDKQAYKRLAEFLENAKDDHIILSYNVIAEARAMMALGLDPLDFTWIDLYLEYRHLLNHNHRLMYGKQLKSGKVVYTKPPKNKWQRDEEDEDEANNSKPDYNMGAAVFKLLGKQIDTKFKDATRDLIISAPDSFTGDEREQILEYCHSDTEHLFPMFKAMIGHYKKLLGRRYDKKQLKKEMIKRAEYSVRSAIMEQDGYPINRKRTANFSKQVPNILLSCQNEIIDLFPENSPFYKFKRDQGTYTKNQSAIRDEIKGWLKKHPKARWMLTSGGKSGKKDLSLSLKAFQRHFNYTHTYPKDNYFAQIIRYLKLNQNLNGFSAGGKTNFWDYVGSDDFVRPFMGIYGAQSSRSQPKASSFIPLKSAWMRCLIEPPSGYAMGSIDFKSQEFLIAALLSGDENMLRDYLSGDVYLAFAKSTKYIPEDGTKAEYKTERDNCKPVILGIQFDMTEIGLSKDLTEKWGRKVSEEEALGWINKHKRAYPKLWKFKKNIQNLYKRKKFLKLPDGWHLWGDNPNFRSVGNFPIQGMGACIMRKAVELAQKSGLRLTYTLHDALYIMAPEEEIEVAMSKLAKCMDKAFRFYFPDNLKKQASVGLEADIWGQGIKPWEGMIQYKDAYGNWVEMETKYQTEYIDPRGYEEYEFFKKYLEDTEDINFKDMEF